MSHLRQLKKQTSALLVALGPDADAVADRLRDFGVHGVPGSNHSCAVARFLSVQLGTEPTVRSVAVGPCSLIIHLQHADDPRPAGRLFVQLPRPVRHFIAAFDEATYPDMVVLPDWYQSDGCSAADETGRREPQVDQVPG